MGARVSRWLLVVITLLVVSLGVGVTAFSGVAAADMPDTSQCSAVSWTNQTISGQTYYEVDTLDKLQCIDDKGLGNNYVLTRDINASETSTWDSNNGFDPIGDKNNEFTGTFDGDDHTISGLTINRGGTYSVGLFSEVASGGTITNIGLEGGSVTGARRTGQLAGYNDGTVENSHVTGEVTGTYRVGGLVGRNDGTVRRSYAIGEPTRGSDWFGGLVGFNQGTVNRSFAARAVDGGGGSTSAGGLVGVSTGTIADSYATGTVTASWYAGGVLGSFQADPGGTVQRSYATGSLSIDDETQGIGGLVGGSAVEPTTVEQAYWDVGTTNEDSVSTGDGWEPITFTDVSGFGATADTAPAPEMQGASAETNMTGLDFTNTWGMVEREDTDAAMDGYPILRGIDRTEQLQAQGIAKPVVESITRNDPDVQATTAERVNLTVTFSEPVTGVDADDFTLATTGTATTANGDDDISVTGADSRYIVTVDTVSGTGDLGVDLVDDDSITDADGNALVESGAAGSTDGSYTGGESFTVDNTGPTFTTSENWAVAENTVIVADVNATDGNGNDTNITYSLVGGVDRSAFSTNATTGTLSFDSAPDFENATDADGDNEYVVDVQAADEFGINTTETITVTVIDAAEPRVAPDNSSQTTREDTVLSIADGESVNLIQLGTATSAGDSLTAVNGTMFSGGRVLTLGSGANLTVYGNGSWTYDPNGQFESLEDGENTTDNFTYTVSDVDGDTARGTITVTIIGVDEPTPHDLGSSSSSSNDPEVRVTAGDKGEGTWRVDVSDPSTDEPVEILLSDTSSDDTERNLSLTGLQMNIDDDSDFELDITTSDAGSGETEPSFTSGTEAQSMGTITVDHTIADEDIEDVIFTVSLRKSQFADSGLNSDSVALYRAETTQWNRLPTTIVEETDARYTLEATSPGLSTFVIGSTPVANTTDTTITTDESAATTESDITDTIDTTDEPATTASDSPGFGVVLTVIAMLVGTFVVRRARCRSKQESDSP
ncbi:GLUG motif-containing protein [Haloferax volcanii]|uniref:GLUG motif domain protein n=3 Tax=Haloferax volcanii TaxID=2246 RepID=A0A384LQM6_HALVD|nr:GLUG motif-containing protein [Haloferax volcanii]ADE01722.2 putative secreted glycoprotein [Haloferax volcanii DS2]ELY31583.1 GLUG motif domain protein [Haloferax volcanii DS2]MBS8121086.1 PGF-pre-PGF domain-containing protein [Haloferax volcanii]MBS8126097.1 PGF-pre-PGF domain-containing protein [Haloferax volcanii]MBS8129951.1 PGF-pre-PGF domain-containing protein [Haloferax volcanii]